MRVLVVEDNEDSRVLLQQALTGSGFEVTTAINGVEALSQVHDSQPELIISDILMPEMDGFALCRELKKTPELSIIPFIFYSATYVDAKDEKLAHKLGADKFVIKPQPLPDLLRIIDDVMNNRKTVVDSNAGIQAPEDFELYRDRIAKKLDKKVRELESERKSLREREAHFRHLVETAQAVPWEMETSSLQFTYVGPQAFSLLGYAAESWYEEGFWISRLHPDDSTAVQRFHESCDSRAGNHEIEFRMFNTDGKTIWIRSSTNTSVESEYDNKCTGFMFDITQQKEDEEKLMRQANFDNLTGLPNRALALDRLAQALLRHRRDETICGLLFIDLDQFKKINDTQGHEIGDLFLIQAANRLKACMRDGDTTARLGGDEFLVILTELDNVSYAEVIAEKVLAAFARPFTVQGHEYFITASIGITLHPYDGTEPHTLLRNADAAMYQAKHDGRNTYRFFTQKMNDRALKRLDMESQLRHALENDELELCFHSFHDIASGRTIGGEGLMRWHNEELGSVSPEEFVPLAEEIGLIVPMGEWITVKVCEQIAFWQEHGKDLRFVSVNVSPRQLRDDNYVRALASALQRTGIDASVLMLEVTEQLFMEDIPQVQKKLAMIKELGVQLAIDDFGMGYSSLGYLKKFSFDVLKIDRGFMNGVPQRAEDAALTSAMIVLAHSLGLKVIGEGVETKEQLMFLKERQCDMAQGYYFDKPTGINDFSEALMPLCSK